MAVFLDGADYTTTGAILKTLRRTQRAVVAVIVLIAFAIPILEARIQTAREVVLQRNLAMLREQIQQYTQDRKGAPESLQDLIDRHYIRELPQDMTNSND